MRNLLVGLLWLWLLVALAVYAYRIWRRISRGPAKGEPADGPSGLDAPRASSSTRVEPASPAAAEPPPIDTLPPAAPPVPPPTRSPAQEPGPTPGGRTGLFAPLAGETSAPAAPQSEARPTVAEILAGIQMPCDLTPIVTAAPIVDAHRVAFSTDTSPAPVVGSAIGDELERLGFSLASAASNQLVATKEGARVTVTIHTDPSAVTIAEAPAYPNAKPGSVVVEFRT